MAYLSEAVHGINEQDLANTRVRPEDADLIERIIELELPATRADAGRLREEQARRLLVTMRERPRGVRNMINLELEGADDLIRLLQDCSRSENNRKQRLASSYYATVQLDAMVSVHVTARCDLAVVTRIFAATTETLVYYTELRARLISTVPGINLTAVPTEVDDETLFESSVHGMLPDVALRIDPGCFGAMREIPEKWAVLLQNRLYVVPRDCTDFAYHSTNIPAWLPAENYPRMRVVTRRCDVNGDNEQIIVLERTKRGINFPAVPDCVPTALNGTHVLAAEKSIFLDLIFRPGTNGQDLPPEPYRVRGVRASDLPTQYDQARFEIHRLGKCFRPVQSAPDGISTFRLPCGRYAYHGNPLPWLSSDVLRYGTRVSDLLETDFVVQQMLTRITPNYRYGRMDRPGTGIRMLHEHRDIAGATRSDGTNDVFYFDTSMQNVTVIMMEMMAEKITAVVSSLDMGGPYKISGSMNLPGRQRYPGVPVVNIMHEQIVESYSGGVCLTFHLEHKSLREAGPFRPEMMRDLFPQVPAETLGKFGERMDQLHSEIVVDVQNKDESLAHGLHVSLQLCHAQTISRLVELLHLSGISTLGPVIKYTPLISMVKDGEALIQFPKIYLHDSDRDTLSALLLNRTWAPYTHVTLLPGKVNGLHSVYPLTVPDSPYMFVIDGIYDSENVMAVNNQAFEGSWLTQAESVGGYLDTLRDATTRQFSAAHVTPGRTSNMHLIGCVINSLELPKLNHLSNLQDAPVRLQFSSYIRRYSRPPPVVERLLSSLKPCKAREGTATMECGCPITTMMQILQCKRVILMLVSLIDPVTMTEREFCIIVHALLVSER
jgi:hypothetical protein